MTSSPQPITVRLGFTRPDHVSPDTEREGLLRAKTIPMGRNRVDIFDFQACEIRDDCAHRAPAPVLERAGFEVLDLSGHADLQGVLATIGCEDRISDASAQAVRDAVGSARFRLSGGKALEIQHVAEDGMILRRAGPNGLDANPGGMDGRNNHDGAMGIHGDQDVFGTPLKQMMQGAAPQLFRHRTPDGRNDESNLFLLNLWIPIQQITRPLVLMDRDTLDAPRHQLRYGLPVTSFLERDEESSINDIWTFLHDPGQEWHFRSVMGPGQAWVFDTLGQPHGACILPGEDALEALYQLLAHACAAIDANDEAALREISDTDVPSLPEVTTEPVREACRRMTKLLREAATDPEWTTRARAAQDSVIRKSIEMRMVANLVPA